MRLRTFSSHLQLAALGMFIYACGTSEQNDSPTLSSANDAAASEDYTFDRLSEPNYCGSADDGGFQLAEKDPYVKLSGMTAEGVKWVSYLPESQKDTHLKPSIASLNKYPAGTVVLISHAQPAMSEMLRDGKLSRNDLLVPKVVAGRTQMVPASSAVLYMCEAGSTTGSISNKAHSVPAQIKNIAATPLNVYASSTPVIVNGTSVGNRWVHYTHNGSYRPVPAAQVGRPTVVANPYVAPVNRAPTRPRR